jgi:hypothetical protein
MRRAQSKNKFSKAIRRAVLPAVLTASLLTGCRGQEPGHPSPDSGPRISSRSGPDSQLPISESGPARETPEPANQEPILQEAPELVIAVKTAKTRPLSVPRTYSSAMDTLRQNGLKQAAQILEGRVNQRSPKMKLTKAQALNAAGYLLADLEEMPNTTLLYYEMPRATIELVRAVHERGVKKQDAEEISSYLLRFIDSMDLGNLKQLDINHSHIIGREWEQIDYSGERLDPQKQKRNGQRMGVLSFKKALYIHRYFTHASKAGYFRKIYRPNGTLPDF